MHFLSLFWVGRKGSCPFMSNFLFLVTVFILFWQNHTSGLYLFQFHPQSISFSVAHWLSHVERMRLSEASEALLLPQQIPGRTDTLSDPPRSSSGISSMWLGFQGASTLFTLYSLCLHFLWASILRLKALDVVVTGPGWKLCVSWLFPSLKEVCMKAERRFWTWLASLVQGLTWGQETLRALEWCFVSSLLPSRALSNLDLLKVVKPGHTQSEELLGG